MNKMIKISLIVTALLAICFYALLPLFHTGFFTIHDDEQIGRLYEMYLVLSQGQIPPRWVPDLGFGFGFPLFNFYPPLVYYLGSLFHLIGFSFINATKIVMGLGFVLSATSMFVWVRKHFGVVAGLFAAILYTYAPYHSVDTYVRGALSEFFSWIWIPAIFWSIDMLLDTLQKRYVVLLGIFFALLMLSHTLVMLQFGPLLFIYLLFAFFRTKKEFQKKLLFLTLAFSLGLGLSAYFWIPSLLEKQYTLVDTILTRELANYAIHFVCPIQLWSGPWGYGGSVAGCVDGLSFQTGKIQAIVGLSGVILGIGFFLKKKNSFPLSVSLIFVSSIFFTLPYSKFLWDFAKPFWYIQFPWRYLLFVAVASAFLGGFIISVIQKRFGKYIAIGCAVVLSSLAIYQVRNYFHPQTYLLKTDAQYTSKEDLQWRVSGLSYEYVPKNVPTRLSPNNTTELTIGLRDLPEKSFRVVSGNIQVKELENKSQIKRYTTVNAGIVQINTFVFPGWVAYIDGKKVEKFIKNNSQIIQLEIPKGTHTVTVLFQQTPVEQISSGITLASIGLLVLGIIYTRKKKVT